MPIDRRRSTGLCALLFFASGFSALVYQVIWQRMLALFSGVQTQSITIIVGAFMAGLGFGSLFGGRLADRLSRRNAVLAFAVCEVSIGLFALASPWLYYDMTYLRLGFLARTPFLQPVIHFALLLPPTFLMGASLPLLSRAFVHRTLHAASIVGLLYGVNTIGAALGAGTAAWYLMGALGFVSTIQLAAVVNLAVAGGAVWIHRMTPAREARVAEMPSEATPDGPGLRFGAWCAIYALSGAVALSLEMLWFRILDITIKSSPYTFGHLLGVFLGCLALGSLAGIFRVTRSRRPDLVFLWGQWGISAVAGVMLVLLVRAPLEALGLAALPTYWNSASHLEISQVLWALHNLGEQRAGGIISLAVLVYIVLPLFLLAVPAFLMGYTFTRIQRAVQTDIETIGWRVGALVTANICGSILGSLITGMLLLDWLGTPATVRALVASGALFAVLVWIRARRRFPRTLAVAAIVASLLVTAAVPGAERFWARLHGAEPSAIRLAEDASGVAALHAAFRNLSVLKVNGKAHSMLPYGDGRSLFGLIPTLLHPNPTDIFAIGLGTGNTPWALASVPAVQQMDLYEIVRPELSVLEKHEFGGGTYPAIPRVLDDPRVRLHFADGRLALRSGGRRYDLIQADGAEPSMANSGNLYSREFFELCRSRLKPDGLFLTMAPTARVLRTMTTVFPHILDFHSPHYASFIIGSNEPLQFDAAAIRARLAEPAVQDYLRLSGQQQPVMRLMNRFLDGVTVITIDGANRADPVDGDINTDLFPRDEFDKTYTGGYH